MSAHRYWRVLMPAGGGFYAYAMVEMRMCGSIGGPTLTTGGTAFATGADSGRPASNAFDGNTSNYWSDSFGGPTAPTSYFLGYDFGTPVDIQEITMRAGPLIQEGMQIPNNGIVQYSDDGIAFGDAWTYSQPAVADGATLTTDAPIGPTVAATNQIAIVVPSSSGGSAQLNQLALIVVVLDVSEKASGAYTNQIAVVAPVLDSPDYLGGARVNQIALVCVDREYEIPPHLHGWLIPAIWGFPLYIEESSYP